MTSGGGGGGGGGGGAITASEAAAVLEATAAAAAAVGRQGMEEAEGIEVGEKVSQVEDGGSKPETQG